MSRTLVSLLVTAVFFSCCAQRPSVPPSENPPASAAAPATGLQTAGRTPQANSESPLQRADRLLAETTNQSDPKVVRENALAAAQLFEANGGSKEQLGAAKFIVGMSLTGELRFREALPYIQRAVELDPGVPEYQTALQNIKGDQHTAEALMKCQESKYDLALQSASTALDILNTSKPDTERIALALYAKAMALAGGGRIDEALDVVKKAVKLAPGNSTYVGATQDLSLAQLQAAHEEKQRALRAKIAALEQERLNLLTMAPPAVGYPMDSGCGKASVDLADASSFLSNAGQSNTVEEAQDLARKAQFAAWDAENAAGQCRCEGGSQASSAAGWAELHAGRASHEDDPEELADLLRKAQSEVDDALQATANCNADESAEENAEEYEEF